MPDEGAQFGCEQMLELDKIQSTDVCAPSEFTEFLTSTALSVYVLASKNVESNPSAMINWIWLNRSECTDQLK